jgi:hypothetical protein
MKHRATRASAAVILGALALGLTPLCHAAAEPQVPTTWAWHALPSVVPAGSTVIVRTRDGQSSKGRVRSLSDTNIVLEGGHVRSFPAADVVAIEGGREGHSARNGAALGFGVGTLFGLGMAAGALDEDYCNPETSLTWRDAALGGAVMTAVGAGIGAGIGLLVPPRQVLVYSVASGPAPAKNPVPLAASWDAVARDMTPGASVVVRARDGRSAKGRLRSVSDRAIAVESGKTMTIAAEDVESITEARRSRRVGEGAAVGITVGIMLAITLAGGAMSTEYCDCDNGAAPENALLGALFAPAIGAGIGAGIGLVAPGKRAVVYRQPVGPRGVSLAPIAGRGQRGVAVRVAF